MISQSLDSKKETESTRERLSAGLGLFDRNLSLANESDRQDSAKAW